MFQKILVAAIALSATSAMAQDAKPPCAISAKGLQSVLDKLAPVAQMNNGGIFSPNRMWAAVVDRQGILCGMTKVGDAWPGSRAIAIAKAETANNFSNTGLSLSTANLYAATQPGGSLYGLNNSNPFNPAYNKITVDGSAGSGVGQNPGGIITFGGGVPLYFEGRVIGGLGVSGDSACADHVIAYRMRRLAHLDTIPGGVSPGNTDNIAYPTGSATPTGFQHPHCFPQDLAPGDI